MSSDPEGFLKLDEPSILAGPIVVPAKARQAGSMIAVVRNVGHLYVVTVPDAPEVEGSADTGAVVLATAALKAWVEARKGAGLAIPTSRSLDELLLLPELIDEEPTKRRITVISF